MPCIHGLDEINCPICRMTSHTLPKKFIESKNPRNNPLKPETLNFKTSVQKKNTLKYKLPKNKEPFEGFKLINSIPNSPFSKKIPEFKNKMFEKRMREIDIGNPDTFGVSEKSKFPNPDLDINEFARKD
ncbi:MAG: hypothetical protein GF311_00050 [Candidatus Lokiarchaeota archaeon]|nr:hypothetical protein [Candidatus Lokiarchaeota archaeon]